MQVGKWVAEAFNIQAWAFQKVHWKQNCDCSTIPSSTLLNCQSDCWRVQSRWNQSQLQFSLGKTKDGQQRTFCQKKTRAQSFCSSTLRFENNWRVGQYSVRPLKLSLLPNELPQLAVYSSSNSVLPHYIQRQAAADTQTGVGISGATGGGCGCCCSSHRRWANSASAVFRPSRNFSRSPHAIVEGAAVSARAADGEKDTRER
jgi:hypothetical protein